MSITPPSGYAIYSRTYRPIGGTHDCVSVFGHQNTIGSTPVTMRAALDTLYSQSGAPYQLSLLSTDWEYLGSYLLANYSGILGSSASPSTAPGTNAIDTPGPGTSLVVRKVTANAGRQYRGRTALVAGFLDEAGIDSAGIVDGADVALWQTRFDNLLTTTFASPYPSVLIHGPHGDPPLPGPTPTGILAYLVTDLVGSQRRRLRGR
jgi:hypothetical protein